MVFRKITKCVKSARQVDNWSLLWGDDTTSKNVYYGKCPPRTRSTGEGSKANVHEPLADPLPLIESSDVVYNEELFDRLNNANDETMEDV